jgi:hypothetical protein
MARKLIALVGVFCLPSSSRFHCSEPERSPAWAPGQTAYVLAGRNGDEYPLAVVLTANHDIGWTLGQEVETQHAEVRKNLPPRRVVGIMRPDGTVEGDIPPKGAGLPHWEFIGTKEDNTADGDDITAFQMRLEMRRGALAAATRKNNKAA